MMRKIKNIISILVIVSIMIAGFFCYKGIQTVDSHCSTEQASTWCSSVLEHKTVISGAILLTVITIFFTSLSVYVSNYIFKKCLAFSVIRQKIFYKHLFKIIISPLEISFSKGILHPRIP